MAAKRLRAIKTKRPPISEQMLADASWHLWYEREMLNYCGNILVGRAPSSRDQFAVLMESFLIHARNLNYFFYAKEMAEESKNRKAIWFDDVIAEDYFENLLPWSKPLENRLSRDEIDKMNKQLAHISYARKITNRSAWDFQGIQTRLLRTVDAFVRAVPRERLHPALFGAYPGNYFYVDE